MRASVLLPVYDAAATLRVCLRSIARQTEPDFECLIVDDGSRDASLEVTRAFAAADPRFRVLALPHRGLVAALGAGLAACRAPVVVRMDADDWMHRERLAAQLAAIDAGADVVGCRVRIFPRAGLSDGRRAYEAWLNAVDGATLAREAFIECPIAHPGLAARRQLMAELGYRDRGWPEDWDLVLRMVERGARFAVVPRRLLGWRDGPGRLSRIDPAYGLDRFMACRAHFLARGFLAASESYVLWGYGGTGKALRRELEAYGKRPRAIVELHPGRLGQRIFGAEVIAPERLREAAANAPILVSVAGAEPRAQIRAALACMGFRDGRDFLCCA